MRSLLLFCCDPSLEMNLKLSYDNKPLVDVQNKLIDSFTEKKMQFRGFAISISMTLKLTCDPIKTVSKLQFVVSVTEDQPVQVPHRQLTHHKVVQQLCTDIYMQ